MPADDRDQKFERALARHLRAGGAQAGCPDAETLAAYHERSLSLEEMAQWKQHIVGCAACQEALALVETTEKELAEQWREQALPVLEAAARPAPAKASARRALASEKAAALAAPSAVVENKRRPMLLRWAVPVGALAAGVLVWIGIHERNTAQSEGKATQVALNRPQAAPQPAMTQPATEPAAPFAERDDKQRDQETARKELEKAKNESSASKLAAPRILNDELKDSQSRAAGRGGEKTGSERGAFSYKEVSPAAVENAPATPDQKPTSPSESLEVSGITPASPPPPAPKPSAPASGSLGNAGAAAAGQRSADLDAKKAEVAKRKSQELQLQSSDAATSAMMMAQGINGRNAGPVAALVAQPVVVLTPDNRVWWKIGARGMVELTTDVGKSWKTIDTGADNELTLGSAPSAKVCWIAGKSGVLVVTADHGKHWKRLVTPITGDLGGVHAADAKRATIWDAAKRVSYETQDGGASWKQVAIP